MAVTTYSMCFLAGFSVDLQVPNQHRRKMEMARSESSFLVNCWDCVVCAHRGYWITSTAFFFFFIPLSPLCFLPLSSTILSSRWCPTVLQDGAPSDPGAPGGEPPGPHLHGRGQLAPGVQMDLQRDRAHQFLLGVQVSDTTLSDSILLSFLLLFLLLLFISCNYLTTGGHFSGI